MQSVNQVQMQSHRLRNTLHSVVLLVGMGTILGSLGLLMFGWVGLLWGMVFWLFSSWFMPRISPQFLLRWMGAQPLQPWETPQLYAMVRELSQKAELPETPVLYLAPGWQANAFALGSVDAPFLGVTEGLLYQINQRQLRGVLAHEIGHIKNGDLRVMELAEGMGRITSMLSTFGLLALVLASPVLLWTGQPFPYLLLLLLLVAPPLTRLLLFALSRTREFEADRTAVWLTEDAMGLASALAQIEAASKPWWHRLFWPTDGLREPSILRTHPHTEERIRRLKEYHASASEEQKESARPYTRTLSTRPQQRVWSWPWEPSHLDEHRDTRRSPSSNRPHVIILPRRSRYF